MTSHKSQKKTIRKAKIHKASGSKRSVNDIAKNNKRHTENVKKQVKKVRDKGKRIEPGTPIGRGSISQKAPHPKKK